MSKNLLGDGDLPPSYNEATTSSPSPFYYPGSSVSSTLTNLTALLRETQAEQTARDTITTSTLLPLLTPHITALLNRLGTTPRPPALAELYLIPAAAVGPEWTIASDADSKAGEVVQVVRVEADCDPDSRGAVDKKRSGTAPDTAAASSSREFDEWGRWDDGEAGSSPGEAEWWWWNDESLARRLAKQLQPEPKLDRTIVRAVVEQAKEEKKASRWGLFRSGNEPPSPSPSATPPPPRQSMRSAPATQEEDVSMTVRAEEVTFRRENEMGIWEGTRGWGIVARVRIRKS
ncbi:hypothetical protein CCHL11_03680 [Colletotrichum chlorophyti]|uniref:Uncharacterized protein n=1 Tax=Colletotrichum chlorophyti TaxID=708187 RepID=A0A1Q8RSX0_9PEZI|nr:hypothetical protein CCHL11_03680 [Colletotrichum chlorophyti]